MKSDVYAGLEFYQVGEIVNSVKYDVPECILPKEQYEEQLHKKGLGRFFTKVPKSSSTESNHSSNEPVKEESKSMDKI